VSSIPPIATNILQEYVDIFPSEIPLWLPPMRGIEHQGLTCVVATTKLEWNWEMNGKLLLK
jgi:hypothetical protein